MQIHEVTQSKQKQLDEGLPAPSWAGDIKKYAKAALDPAAWKGGGRLDKNLAAQEVAQQTQQYVNKLASEWLAGPGKTTVQKTAPAAANTATVQKTAPAAANTATVQKTAPANTTPAVGMRFRVVNPSNQGTYFKTGNTWSTELGQPIVAPKTIEYLEKLLDGGAGREEPTPTNKIREAPEYTTPAGIVVPGGAKTAAPTSASTNTSSTYSNQLRDWTAGKLKSTEPSTGAPITLDDVEANAGTKQQLTRLLTAINQSTGNPTELEKLIKNYLLTAVHGIQQRSAEIRSTVPKAQLTTRRSAGSITNDALYKLGQDVIGRGERVQNPTGSPTIDRMLQQAGLLK
jgi:hypothetical protein